MKLRFTKMQGAGNDFVMLDGVRQRIDPTPTQVRALADRRYGVGADQVLLVEPASSPGVDFRYRIFNADGGEVEHCGNGARCFVKFVRALGLTEQRCIRVEIRSGVIVPCLQDDGEVTVDMGEPVFEPARVPFDAAGLPPPLGLVWRVSVAGHPRELAVLSMGNPHAVQFVDDVDAAPVTTDGPALEHHARFARSVNAGYAQVLDKHTIRLRVWERGAGETLACGTGACAAAVAGIEAGLLASPVRVEARGGRLTIRWDGRGTAVALSGPAVTVFEGELDLDELVKSMPESWPPSAPGHNCIPAEVAHER